MDFLGGYIMKGKIHKKKFQINKCPSCSSTNVGKLGKSSYFCRNCFVQINKEQNQIYINITSEDGKTIERIRVI
ncbi:hypothetical protein Clos_1059 [Alkaliphilus oremlandii OhILAs]|uniref:Uncharacterized protein n=2 Tax=Alkaliphilus oremlandii TaxID=461876 RepID=A8MGR2_ALKOO|nr:hypothetical protein Clos_1059 [Alkaliphilus oremlandii OhILAs]